MALLFLFYIPLLFARAQTGGHHELRRELAVIKELVSGVEKKIELLVAADSGLKTMEISLHSLTTKVTDLNRKSQLLSEIHQESAHRRNALQRMARAAEEATRRLEKRSDAMVERLDRLGENVHALLQVASRQLMQADDPPKEGESPGRIFRKLWRKMTEPLLKVGARVDALEEASARRHNATLARVREAGRSCARHLSNATEARLMALEAACTSSSSSHSSSSSSSSGFSSSSKVGKVGTSEAQRGEPARDCSALQRGQGGGGVFHLHPPAAPEPFAAYCDFETDGGGWTNIARHLSKVTAARLMALEAACTSSSSSSGFSSSSKVGKVGTSEAQRGEPARDCSALQRGQGGGGVFHLHHPAAPEPFAAYCDFETDGGGWTNMNPTPDEATEARLMALEAACTSSSSSHSSSSSSSSGFSSSSSKVGKVGTSEPQRGEPARDCSALQRGQGGGGVFHLHPPAAPEPFAAYCDFETDGGGWTVIQRRGDFGDRLNFTQNWEVYKHGFGDPQREFWLGNEKMHWLTTADNFKLRVELQDFEENSAHAEYSRFLVEDENKQFRLSVGGYKGNATDSLSLHDQKMFSTYDRDNDEVASCCNCADTFKGGWWYYRCFEANLNGPYHPEPTENGYFLGIIWERWKGDYSLKSAEMKIRPLAFEEHVLHLPTDD